MKIFERARALQPAVQTFVESKPGMKREQIHAFLREDIRQTLGHATWPTEEILLDKALQGLRKMGRIHFKKGGWHPGKAPEAPT